MFIVEEGLSGRKLLGLLNRSEEIVIDRRIFILLVEGVARVSGNVDGNILSGRGNIAFRGIGVIGLLITCCKPPTRAMARRENRLGRGEELELGMSRMESS